MLSGKRCRHRTVWLPISTACVGGIAALDARSPSDMRTRTAIQASVMMPANSASFVHLVSASESQGLTYTGW